MELIIVSEFNKNKKYRVIGFCIYMTALLPAFLLDGLLRIVNVVMICGIGMFVSSLYRCPSCHHTLNTRVKASSIEYCHYCQVRLKEESQ